MRVMQFLSITLLESDRMFSISSMSFIERDTIAIVINSYQFIRYGMNINNGLVIRTCDEF